MAINKKDFINRMAENGNKTKKSCREYLDLMFDTFYGLLEEGEAIKFCRIMNAEVKTTPERPARNPQTGEVCMVLD
jgi:nucleoid DNA-binding protein